MGKKSLPKTDPKHTKNLPSNPLKPKWENIPPLHPCNAIKIDICPTRVVFYKLFSDIINF